MKKKITIITPLVLLHSLGLIAKRRFQNVEIKPIKLEEIFEITCVGDDKGGLEYFKSFAEEQILGQKPWKNLMSQYGENVVTITDYVEPVIAS